MHYFKHHEMELRDLGSFEDQLSRVVVTQIRERHCLSVYSTLYAITHKLTYTALCTEQSHFLT